MNIVNIAGIEVGGKNPFILIAGPCVIESEEKTLSIAQAIKDITERLSIPFVFKASYDKANRSSIDSYRGPGIEKGMRILSNVRKRLNVGVSTDVHLPEEVDKVCNVADLVQIPAFLSRQTDLIVAAAGKARAINVKKGQFLAPWDMKNIIRKAESSGATNIAITERGYSFGYNQLITDMRTFPIMRKLGYPVIYDASHSVQLPGGQGTSSGGQREMIPYLARAAVSAGCDGVFIEVHPEPEKALSDGPNSFKLDELETLLRQLQEVDLTVKKFKKWI